MAKRVKRVAGKRAKTKDKAHAVLTRIDADIRARLDYICEVTGLTASEVQRRCIVDVSEKGELDNGNGAKLLFPKYPKQ